ncbi:hypothetical protein C7G42_29465 [Bradyrhizobium sp. MOS003]|nr:hypothetical protein C7G42_29465 [Bradyrhizobium sp. MOS003]
MPHFPSIVPHPYPRDVYLVLEDYGGGLGRGWSETSEDDTGRATLMRQITVEIADELRRCFVEFDDVTPAALEFTERVGRN